MVVNAPNDDCLRFPEWLNSGKYPSKKRLKNAYFERVLAYMTTEKRAPTNPLEHFLQRKLKYHWHDIRSRYCELEDWDGYRYSLRTDLTEAERDIVKSASTEICQYLGYQFCYDFDDEDILADETMPDKNFEEFFQLWKAKEI